MVQTFIFRIFSGDLDILSRNVELSFLLTIRTQYHNDPFSFIIPLTQQWSNFRIMLRNRNFTHKTELAMDIKSKRLHLRFITLTSAASNILIYE